MTVWRKREKDMREGKKWQEAGRQWLARVVSPKGALVAVLAVPLALALWSLYGCCEPNTLQHDYGRSVHNNLAQQILNPQAGQDLTPAVGLDPKAGQNEMDKYDKSFKAEEKQQQFKLLTQY